MRCGAEYYKGVVDGAVTIRLVPIVVLVVVLVRTAALPILHNTFPHFLRVVPARGDSLDNV